MISRPRLGAILGANGPKPEAGAHSRRKPFQTQARSQKQRSGASATFRCAHIQAFTWNSEDHGRLPAVHISKHSHSHHVETLSRSRSVARRAHIQAFATKTCTRAGCGHVHPCCRLGLCLHRRSTAALVWTYITLTFRALRRNHLVSTLFEVIAFTTSPEITKKTLIFVTRESLAKQKRKFGQKGRLTKEKKKRDLFITGIFPARNLFFITV